MVKKQKAKIKFIGLSSQDVTGSMHLVTYKKNKVLLDCGYYQCSNKLKQYKMNARNLNFKVKELDSIIISHLNLDHYGLLPRLYELGCEANIYIPKNSKEYLKVAFKDSLKIQSKDLDFIDKQTGKRPKPLYTEDSVNKMLEYVKEINFNKKIKINEYMQLRYQPAYHILNSAQIELFIRDLKNNYNRKIYYSGDLGNTHIKDKPFLNGFNFVKNSDVAICESTYAMNNKIATQKKRDKDIEKMNTTILETINNGGNYCFASFAYQRAQELLYELYKLYGEDDSFKTPIILDSPLSIIITNMFKDMVEDYDKNKIDKILKWKNLKMTGDWKDSVAAISNSESKIVIAASGFANAGRIRKWMINELPNPNSTICFIGYSSENSLSGIIKAGIKKCIKIDGEMVENKAKACNLTSFSSHIQHDTMLDMYSEMNTKEIYLVHGEMDNRIKFAEILRDKISNKNNTTKVYIGNKDLEIEIK